MSVDRIADIVLQARLASTAGTGVAQGAGASGDPRSIQADRQRLERISVEFESMLLTQMLRDMRKTGSWNEDEERAGLGAETFYETLDVELARHLSHVQGLGLSKQLLEAFERLNGAAESPRDREAVIAAPRESGGFRHGAPESPERAPVTPHVMHAAEPSKSRTSEPLAAPAGAVTSSFGWRRDPLHGQVRFHRGIDIRAAYGQEIQAAGAGVVVFSGVQGAYGTTVLLEHAEGVQTRYAHLSEALVSAGDRLEHGQVVGRAGRSGRATGTHLHFEVIAQGQHEDPRQWAPASATALPPEPRQHRSERAEVRVATVALKPTGASADLMGATPTGLEETGVNDREN